MGFFGHQETKANSVVIVGGGNIGVSLAKRLEESKFGANTKLIELNKIHSDVQQNLNRNTQDPSTLEPQLRYRWIDGILRKKEKEDLVGLSRKSKSEKVDRILTHRFGGPFIFIGLLYLIFQSVFSWAVLPMNWVNNTVTQFGN